MATSEDQNDILSDLPSVEDLLARAQRLLEEVTQFKNHAAYKPYRQKQIPMRDFETGIRSEISHLSAVSNPSNGAADAHANADPEVRARKTALTIRSSNLSSYELIWSTAKQSRSITAFRQWYRLNPDMNERRRENKLRKVRKALVDIVCNDGEEWLKVSSVTVKRLMYDVAKEGWGRFGEDVSDEEPLSDDEDGDERRTNGESEVPDIPLLRSARDLVAAAKANRVRGRIPKVRMVLPRIRRAESREVDALLKGIEDAGCVLTLADDFVQDEIQLHDVIDNLPVNPSARLSSTLNIDCTILISLISDISHVANLQPEPWYNAMLREQLKFEREETLLPGMLYPVLTGRRLFTTEKAAEQCRVIVETIGNDAERARCQALLSEGEEGGARREFEGLSDHAVPEGLQLPIAVVAEDALPADAAPRSPLSYRLVDEVCSQLSAINRSVFGFGWRTGFTTITSNNNTIRELETLLEEHRAKDGSEDDDAAPDCWNCLPRSVVGKYDEIRQSRRDKKNIGRELQFEEGQEKMDGNS